VVWGAIGAYAGRQLGNQVIGGVLLSPLIGLAVGAGSRFLYGLGVLVLVPWSLATLYMAAAFFGVGMGTYDAASRMYIGLIPASLDRFAAIMIERALGAVWAVTIGKMLWWLWPLAFINHLAMRQVYKAEPPLRAHEPIGQ